jgi:hypothetical protein
MAEPLSAYGGDNALVQWGEMGRMGVMGRSWTVRTSMVDNRSAMGYIEPWRLSAT